jgi:menaquinone-dependent protoporphyrinogen oxidase
MKNLVVYFSKHGAAKRAVDFLNSKVKSDVVNVKEIGELEFNNYDNIVIASSVYAGTISKEIKKFISNNYNILKSKNIYFLIICGQESEIKNVLTNNFSEEQRNLFKKVIYGGFEFNFDSMNFIEKFITKKIAKVEKSVSNLNKKNIELLSEMI